MPFAGPFLLLPEDDAADHIAFVLDQLGPELAARVHVVDVGFIHRVIKLTGGGPYDCSVGDAIHRHARIDDFAVPLAGRIFPGDDLDTKLVLPAEFANGIYGLAAGKHRVVVDGKLHLRQFSLKVGKVALCRFRRILRGNKQQNGQGDQCDGEQNTGRHDDRFLSVGHGVPSPSTLN